jgi:hypothetical protein
MAKDSESRREGLLLQAVNPVDGKTCTVQISHARMQAVATRGMIHASECGRIVPAILRGPTAIFEGLRREEDEDQWGAGWRCYCGVPSCSYRKDGSAGPAYPGQVYLVFVNSDGVAYNWRWEKADEDDPRLPVGHTDRFKRRLL